MDAGTVSGRLGCGKDAVVLPRLALHRVLNQALMFSEGGRQTRDKTGFISHQAQVFFRNESAIGDVDGTRRVDPIRIKLSRNMLNFIVKAHLIRDEVFYEFQGCLSLAFLLAEHTGQILDQIVQELMKLGTKYGLGQAPSSFEPLDELVEAGLQFESSLGVPTGKAVKEIHQDDGDQSAVDKALNPLGALAFEEVYLAQGFPGLESQLDLPAYAVDGADYLGRPYLSAHVGHKEAEAKPLPALLAQLSAFLPSAGFGLSDSLVNHGFGSSVGDQTAWDSLLAQIDVQIHNALMDEVPVEMPHNVYGLRTGVRGQVEAGPFEQPAEIESSLGMNVSQGFYGEVAKVPYDEVPFFQVLNDLTRPGLIGKISSTHRKSVDGLSLQIQDEVYLQSGFTGCPSGPFEVPCEFLIQGHPRAVFYEYAVKGGQCFRGDAFPVYAEVFFDCKTQDLAQVVYGTFAVDTLTKRLGTHVRCGVDFAKDIAHSGKGNPWMREHLRSEQLHEIIPFESAADPLNETDSASSGYKPFFAEHLFHCQTDLVRKCLGF